MASLLRTPLFARHQALNGQMVPFGGWEMPLHYSAGILQEHLATRRAAGLFDVSHMGRFTITGKEALPFLQHVLTNNAGALELNESQYTLLATPDGGALDDAYLYRFFEDRYLLVVNAANRPADWDHLQQVRAHFQDVRLTDVTMDMAMLSLQGPRSKKMLAALLEDGALPEPRRNALSIARCAGVEVWIGRTGYTGEPLCFELFLPATAVTDLWNRLLDQGAHPVGLGARDTLRLEAGLPLYGHELGADPAGDTIPVFASPLARHAVSFSPLKGDFIGQNPLHRQFMAQRAFLEGNFHRLPDLPRMLRTVEVIDKGIARAGAAVFQGKQQIGWVTSGTMVPHWVFEGQGLSAVMTERTERRAIALVLIDSQVAEGEIVTIDVRGKPLRAGVMPYLLRSEAPPFARPITWALYRRQQQAAAIERNREEAANRVRHWVQRAVENHRWRQEQCINLIPSEQTPSRLVRLLSITDPAGRYAEHKKVKAFADAEVFYYQGTDFIAAVEAALAREMALFLGCRQVETRPVSGQMANMVVFSAMVDHINRADRKSEQRRLRHVMNHHIIKGGHLSAQPMGALRDYIMRDPVTERPAVINFPVLPNNPYTIDVAACRPLLERYQPELVILGKSMTLHREPVADLRRMIDKLQLDTVLMVDMAHVLGLYGPHFQAPFAEGADLLTGSTHKTFFGTQRGIVAGNGHPDRPEEAALWEAVQRRAFPGAVSNHHLGTLLGLLAAAIEMNAFKERYQPQVIANAKAFARSLHACGLKVAGDPNMDFTETHQVIVQVGYGQGPDIARQLEENHIICNYQAGPDEEGFTASGALRLGVAEMTRFGMQPEDFQTLAQLMADVILHAKTVKDPVRRLREGFLRMRFCFDDDATDQLLEQLHRLL
ncbi:glycine cleavage system aminomethyltransferase GcvT [Desulfatitalea alkaliphila]|uniref:Glycine cleavage system aminomethyltransferase GcvT n=1 Tax=Desulfatitalea alkaliphila TaxID=2929485 RepID=A0AA41QZ25_9BACT|nr:glycine cleavage system aminomethyltransferase GcvT [Desulfatitalea alkaliphila]MCJ8499697.1 glycine cleavage system aminomethyltransferase GcvT [Desulfatitalea alkaliphila]